MQTDYISQVITLLPALAAKKEIYEKNIFHLKSYRINRLDSVCICYGSKWPGALFTGHCASVVYTFTDDCFSVSTHEIYQRRKQVIFY